MQIIYGKNSVETYLEYAPRAVKEIEVQKGLQDKTMEKLRKLTNRYNIPMKVLDSRQFMQKVPPKAVHQGVLAHVEDFVYTPLNEALAKAQKNADVKAPLFLLLDQVQDPRNLGAIIRTADCAGGVDGIIIPKNNSAEVTAAAIKTSTGAALNVPIIQVTNAKNTIKQLKDAGIWICSLNMDGAVNYRKQDYMLPMCMLIGGEDAGVRPLLERESDFRVYIPMESKTVNSLNVSVATSLLLYEVASQRNPDA